MADKQPKPSRGTLLLAEPFLVDPNFKRCVILLAEHSDEAVIGYILNKPTKLNLSEIVKDFPDFDAHVSLGGPVHPDTLHYLHRLGDRLPESVEICPGVYWSGDFDQLKTMIKAGEVKPDDVRFFVGYSGWSADQLAEEMKENTWLLTDCRRSFVFNDGKPGLWARVLRSMGTEYAMIANAPAHPSLN